MKHLKILSSTLLLSFIFYIGSFIFYPFFGEAKKEVKSYGKVAVTEASYDDMKQILDELNVDSETIKKEDLKDKEKLMKYSAVYINCASIFIKDTAVKEYVESGGIVYASDWASLIIKEEFSEKIKFNDSINTKKGKTTATIKDPGLKEVIKKDEVEINFDLGGWHYIESVSNDVNVLIEGPVITSSYLDEDKEEGDEIIPYVITFEYGDGEVLYTSFHNESQKTEDMGAILSWFAVKLKTGKLVQEKNDLIEDNGGEVIKNIIDYVNNEDSKSYEYKPDNSNSFNVSLNFEKDLEKTKFDLIVKDSNGNKVFSDSVSGGALKKEVGNSNGEKFVFEVSAKTEEKNLPFFITVSQGDPILPEENSDKKFYQKWEFWAMVLGISAVIVLLYFGFSFFVKNRKKQTVAVNYQQQTVQAGLSQQEVSSFNPVRIGAIKTYLTNNRNQFPEEALKAQLFKVGYSEQEINQAIFELSNNKY